MSVLSVLFLLQFWSGYYLHSFPHTLRFLFLLSSLVKCEWKIPVKVILFSKRFYLRKKIIGFYHAHNMAIEYKYVITMVERWYERIQPQYSIAHTFKHNFVFYCPSVQLWPNRPSLRLKEFTKSMHWSSHFISAN